MYITYGKVFGGTPNILIFQLFDLIWFDLIWIYFPLKSNNTMQIQSTKTYNVITA